MKNGDHGVTAPVFPTTRDEDEMSAFGDDDDDVPVSSSDMEDGGEEGPPEDELIDDIPLPIQDRKSDREAVAGRHLNGVRVMLREVKRLWGGESQWVVHLRWGPYVLLLGMPWQVNTLRQSKWPRQWRRKGTRNRSRDRAKVSRNDVQCIMEVATSPAR